VEEARASIISFEVLIEESVEAFTPERQAAIDAALAAELACLAPACRVETLLAPGSVNLEIALTIPNQDGGDSITPAVLESAHKLMAAQGEGSRLAAVFGASVSGSASPTLQRDVTVLRAVSKKPPPSPPPSPPPPPLSPPPSPSPPDDGFTIGVVVGVAVGAALCLSVAVALLVCCRRSSALCVGFRLRKKSTSRGSDGGEDNETPAKAEEKLAGGKLAGGKFAGGKLAGVVAAADVVPIHISWPEPRKAEAALATKHPTATAPTAECRGKGSDAGGHPRRTAASLFV